ncbi:MAG: porin family protein [Acidobacteria bacterium]|nr:porin family protein [Acidobacteriota bacterium]
MNWRKVALCVAAMFLFAVPSWAGSFGVYGSYWDSNDASSSWGGGVRMGFDFFKWMELEFHGTYFPDFGEEILGSTVDITATPVDGGLRFNFLPDAKVNVYAGAGASYYFMDATDASMDNTTGWYGEAGLEFGKNSRFFVEAMWRVMDTSLSFGSFDEDADFDGISGQVGFNWSWGK